MPNSPKKAPRQDPNFPHDMSQREYLDEIKNPSKAAAGQRQAHDQMERNFHNDRDKPPVKGQSTTPPKK